MYPHSALRHFALPFKAIVVRGIATLLSSSIFYGRETNLYKSMQGGGAGQLVYFVNSLYIVVTEPACSISFLDSAIASFLHLPSNTARRYSKSSVA